MFTTSAALALVLHLPPHPLPRQPTPHVSTSSTSASTYVRGEHSPWPVLPWRQTTHVVVALETGKARQQTQAQDPLPDPNLDQALPGGTFLPNRPSAGAIVGPANQPPQPTYESWDVLRQYPHTAPLAPPTPVPVVQERSSKSPSMEKHDVQTPQTPSP